MKQETRKTGIARRVEPKVFLIGATALRQGAIAEYLAHVKAAQWAEKNLGRASDPEMLVEFMGRLCYRSWAPGLNPNVSRIREGNDLYLKNILSSRHGSVLEHSVTNWIFADVSRVFTHELVRHRAGTAFSQESLRFVRLEDLGFWIPPEAAEDVVLKELFERTFSDMAELQTQMAQHLRLDEEKDFHRKKILTSAMRRLAPDGLATTIGVSFNFRALRHVVEMRTAESSETEIRLVFGKVAEIAKSEWPNLFQDFTRNEKGEWKPDYSKV